ncbi:lactadherin-like [Asterias rubens]|uniref:lactadherin-like n=1 Tax=Asterias rubens TaxID=7604 RepID=UPI0014558474|nr:lactadherin-like [Asterias rubens]
MDEDFKHLTPDANGGYSVSVVCPIELWEPLGMESGYIPDANIVASTDYNEWHGATNARPDPQDSQNMWCSEDTDSFPWIQVNLNARVYIAGLIIHSGRTDYVETYKVKHGYYSSSLTFATTSSGSTQLFSLSNGYSPFTKEFSSVLHAQYLRIYPVSWAGDHVCLRFEVIGCR